MQKKATCQKYATKFESTITIGLLLITVHKLYFTKENIDF